MRNRKFRFKGIFRGLVVGIAVLVLVNIFLALALANCAFDLMEVVKQCSLN